MRYNHIEGAILKKLNRERLSEVYALKCESWWGTHKSLIVNMDDQQKWFEGIPSNEMYMGVYVESPSPDTFFIGLAAYTDIDLVSRTANVSGSIIERFRGKPMVKNAFFAGVDFAFEILNLHRIQAEVLSYHLSAQRLEFDDIGFKIEGVRRKAVYKSGRYYDSILLGLLREEWEGCERVINYRKLYGSCNLTMNHNELEKKVVISQKVRHWS